MLSQFLLRHLPAIRKSVKMASRAEFLAKLGSPRFVVAPMVNQSELAFRMMCRKYGADLCYTPMFHARLFSESKKYRAEQFTTVPEDRPLVVQFCGNDPDIVLAAAKLVESHCDAVDLNCGCPQSIARRGRYGAFLLDEPQVIEDIVRKLATNLKIPVTVKIRIQPDEEKTFALAKRIERAGAQLLTVHGRTRFERQGKIGPVNWDIIRRIKASLSIPVFANGGLETLEDAKRCMETARVDGVMSSEGLLSNPALFSGTNPGAYELAREYLAFAKKYPASPKAVKSHLYKILHQKFEVHTSHRIRLSASRLEEGEVEALIAEMEAEDEKAEEDLYVGVPTYYWRHRVAEVEAKAGVKRQKKEKVGMKKEEGPGYSLEEGGGGMNCLFGTEDSEEEKET